MTSSISVRLAEGFVAVGALQLAPRGSQVAAWVEALGQPDRVLPLYFNEVLRNTLYIYDELGIRFWAKAEAVTEWQLVLESKGTEVFPQQSYAGGLSYRGQELRPPLPGSALATGQVPGFVLDTDALQRGVTTYVSTGLPLTYAATVNAQTGNVATFSVS